MEAPEVTIAPILTTRGETVAGLIRSGVGPEVTYTHAPDGSPLLCGSALHISISHSRHLAAIALHPELRPGVDIEEPRPGQLERVARKFLSESELQLWRHRLLEAWTCKEAVYKAAGTPGLPLLAIDLTTEGVATLPDGRRFALRTTLTPDYAITVAWPVTDNTY